MSKSILAGVAAAVLLTCAGPAFAQTATPPSAAQSSDIEARRALVRRYFEAIQFEKLVNTMMDSMLTPMLADAPQEKIPVIREAFFEAYGVVLPQMIDANIDIYAEAFTRDELEQLVAFYESPVGRSMMAKTVMLSRQSGAMMERFTPILQTEFMTRLCSRMTCPPVIVPSRH